MAAWRVILFCALGCGSRTELYGGPENTTANPPSNDSGARETGVECSQSGLTVLASGEDTPDYVAIDAANVYWTTQGTGTTGGASVMKVSKCGGTPVTVASVSNSPFALAVDATNVYFATFEGVMKVPTAGGAVTTLASEQVEPYAIAVSGSSVYWTSSTNLNATPVESGASTTIASLVGQSTRGIAVDSVNLYWTQYDGTASGAVMRTPLGGGAPRTVASGLGPAEAVASDGANVYWTSSNTDALPQTGLVMAASLVDGTVRTLAVMQNIDIVSGIAVDGTSVYWTNQLTSEKGGTVMKVAASGGTPTAIATGQGNPQSIAVDDASVYWVDDLGTVMKLTPK